MSSTALFISLIPEFAAVDPAEIDVYLSISADAHTASRFGNRYAEAMVYHAAHMKKLDTDALADAAKGSSSAGPITSRKTGDNAESYASLSASGDGVVRRFFLSTVYGRKYYQIVRTRSAGRAGFFLPG